MLLKRNGIEFSVADSEVARLVLERISTPELQPEILLDLAADPLDPAPRIGEAWQGGIYAGITRGRDGASDYYLIIGPEYDGDVDWNAATEWAKALNVDGFRDWSLPFRKEQALAFANVPELFKERAYWSSETHASYSNYAWSQGFSDGSQGYWGKDDKGSGACRSQISNSVI